MPKKPNYNFEKRQKELARERKREAKEQEKRERRDAARATSNGEVPPPSDPLPDIRPA